MSKPSVLGWLSPNGKRPSAANIAKVRDWLDQAPAVDDWPALRERLDATIKARGLQRRAAAGQLQIRNGTINGWLVVQIIRLVPVSGDGSRPKAAVRFHRWQCQPLCRVSDTGPLMIYRRCCGPVSAAIK